MVLLYIKNPLVSPKQQHALVLDNYIDSVKKGTERKDLLAVKESNNGRPLLPENY
jgi:hypothetical protein